MAQAPTSAVTIVGAGWAGLSAAVELTQKGHQVTLIDAAKTAGGRARSVMMPNQSPSEHDRMLDNGQHILLGAYTATLAMLKKVGLNESDCFQRETLHLAVLDIHDKQRSIDLQFANLPAPLHALLGLFKAQGLSIKERGRFIQLCLILKGIAQKPHNPAHDEALLRFMQSKQQPERLIRMIWAPLCLAALNTPIEEASLHLFSKVILDSFFASTAHSNALFPKQGLSQCFPDAAIAFIQKNGGNVWMGERVQGLHIRKNSIQGLILKNTTLPCQRLILAVPPAALNKLCFPHTDLAPLKQNLDALASYPIVTVYLQYPESVALTHTMQGLTGGISQWLLDRRCCGQKGLIACVISGPETPHSPHRHLSKTQLAAQVSAECAQCFSHWPAPLYSTVIREKHATFASKVGVQIHRPSAKTPIKGLTLAGDFTDTGYPATLEGAVRSGLKAAAQNHVTLKTPR